MQNSGFQHSHNCSKSIALYLPRFSIYGGVERFAYNFAQFLIKKNHKVFFICARQEVKAPPGLKLICTGRPPLTRSLKLMWYILWAEKIKKQIQADIHFSLGKTLSQDILRIGGGPLKIFWELSQKAYPGLEGKIKITRRKLALVNWLTFWIEKKQLLQAKKIICVSDLVKNWLLQAYPFVPEKKIEVIYNLPDLTKFSCKQTDKNSIRQKFNLPQDKTLILTVATNFKLKGVHYLIQSLKHLPEDHLLIVAGGRNPATYLKLAHRLHLDKRIIFLGQVKNIERVYNACDIFILNSFYDACSNALLEALASGLTCLSSQYNGSCIFLPQNNIIKDPSSPIEIAQKILQAQPTTFKIPPSIKSGFEHYYNIIKEI
ncbi:MAG: glycosyltransferase family 4 protein [Desulfonauticus sp.]|nr:glycosyltransferase family 4 protein [Desulfonauticus sp.]